MHERIEGDLIIALGWIALGALLVENTPSFSFHAVDLVEASDVHILELRTCEGDAGHPLDAMRTGNDTTDAASWVEVLYAQFRSHIVTSIGISYHTITTARWLEGGQNVALCIWVWLAAHRHVGLFELE